MHQPNRLKTLRSNFEPGHYWHTKTVTFPAHSVRRVQDVYTRRVGGGITALSGKSGSASQIAYVLHAGSSWHGAIGRSEINVTFTASQISGAPHLLPVKQVSKINDGRGLNVASVAPSTIVWQGPCAPKVTGKTLQFVRTHWRPSVHDDLILTYGYK